MPSKKKKNEYSTTQLAAIYNVYKHMDSTRTVHCCTCGKPIYIAEVGDAMPLFGHFYARSQEPLLKLHPDNTQVQCVLCNMTPSKDIDEAFAHYMERIYGPEIFEKLISERGKYADGDRGTRDFYVGKLTRLAQQFPELRPVVGLPPLATSASDVEEEENPASQSIVKQFKTYCQTYRQDLDELTKALKTEHIEYERI